MSDVAIQVRDLGKRYTIDGGPSVDYMGMHGALERAVRAPFRRLASAFRPSADGVEREHGHSRHHWALRDVSFDLRHGEVLGLVGHNGAGKSVLLKILSRVTTPTEGYARIRGRVGSMLEVGAGFHPELTGWENIYLSGAILGMSRADIARHFDEIVEFAGVERFLHTPVKRYSSGMEVRLAFAVAAHLDPEIMLIDEVLAVGDEAFRTKAVARMRAATSEGRTVLFVSHDMDVVEQLCGRALWIEAGHIVMNDATETVVRRYLAAGGGNQHHDPGLPGGTGQAHLAGY